MACLVLGYGLLGTLGGLVRTGKLNPTGAQAIYLLPGPIHTDIVLPATPEVQQAFGFADAFGVAITDPDTAWIIAGWGSQSFYTETAEYSDLSLGTVMRAVTGDRSVLRIDTAPAGTPNAALTRIEMDETQLAALINAIVSSFANPVMALDHPGLTDSDRFFAAQGRFHLFRTCNVWVGNRLRDAGLRVGLWTPFNWSLP